MVGDTVGSYRIISHLGAGAMGDVYVAEHRHLKRKAALKLLSLDLVDRPDLIERFFLEARATSAIDHPGIVRIFDCEVDPTGRPYIVMEYLAGETLAALLERRAPLPALMAALLAQGMAEALAAAHANGIIHRDVKPENVFVQAHPPNSIKLLDFGIAKLAGDFQAGRVHQTHSGMVMGTPLYMSPEQGRDSGRVDLRTDLYSLGCVIYAMLTGRPPFMHTGFGELVVAHLTEEPKDPRALNPAVPPALAELTMHLLRKDPAQRPASMSEVAHVLAGFAAQATTAGARTPPPASIASAPELAHSEAAATGPRTTFATAAAELLPAGGKAASRRRWIALLGIGGAAVAAGAVFQSRLRPAGHDETPHESSREPTRFADAALAQPARPQNEPERTTSAPPVRTTPAPRRAKDRQPPAAPRPLPPQPGAPLPRWAGVWEGPWVDPGKQQKGRLYLKVDDRGGVAGWMANTGANKTFRLAGKLSPGGELELDCQCPPGQDFAVRGNLRADGAELEGQLALSAGARVFGESHVQLKPVTAPP